MPAGRWTVQQRTPIDNARTVLAMALVTPETELDMELFMAVTTELGDVVLGPPGMLPADYENLRK
jgi:hypothetical protein